jgi:cleavage and polyadenylation specificity factor subunit 1
VSLRMTPSVMRPGCCMKAIFKLTETDPESYGGQRLLRRADFRLGQSVFQLRRLPCVPTPSELRSNPALIGKPSRRHACWWGAFEICATSICFWGAERVGGADGSVSALLPLPERVYKRLVMLQNRLVTFLPQRAGLNPKLYRYVGLDSDRVLQPVISHVLFYSAYQPRRAMLVNPTRNILEGDLIARFLWLSVMEQRDLARQIGTTVQQLVEDVVETDMALALY